MVAIGPSVSFAPRPPSKAVPQSQDRPLWGSHSRLNRCAVGVNPCELPRLSLVSGEDAGGDFSAGITVRLLSLSHWMPPVRLGLEPGPTLPPWGRARSFERP